MSDSTRGNQQAKAEAEKKQPETVLLTAEELRAIAGGASPGKGPNPVSGDVTTQPKIGTGPIAH